jgi:hypothetical protein
LWLTQQKRVDKDYALFGEASFDITPTDHADRRRPRGYKYDNTLIGFFGFGRNPGGGFTDAVQRRRKLAHRLHPVLHHHRRAPSRQSSPAR